MISKEDIENLATLARLKLKEGEAEALQKDISNILGYVGQVGSFAATAANNKEAAVRNVLREDVPRAETDVMAGKEEAILSQLPKREGNYNVVRKIIQKDE